MAFNVKRKPSENTESTVDWDAYNQYIVETCALETRETMVGYISAIVDLGMQEQEDAMVEWTGTEDQEIAECEKYENTYFEDVEVWDDKVKKKVVKRFKRWPQPPMQHVAMAVDFPQIMLNKGQFFGDESSEELPLRMWLGGEFVVKNSEGKFEKIISRPFSLRQDKKTGDAWGLAANSIMYKMALISGLISKGEAFPAERIDELLGKAFSFEVEISFKKVGDKKYMNEYIKYSGGVPRGTPVPELFKDPILIMMDADNDLDELRELRASVKRTIQRANDYAGSAIEAQFKQIEASASNSSTTSKVEKEEEEPQPVNEPKAKAKAPKTKVEKVAKPTKSAAQAKKAEPDPEPNGEEDEENPFL